MSDETMPAPSEPSPAAALLNRRPARPESHDSATWLITFTDLVALLLAFFVMLFAMSKVDLRKWQNLTDALARGLNSVRQETAVAPHHSLDVEVAELTAGQDLDYLAGVLSQQLAAALPGTRGKITRHSDRLVLTLPLGTDDRESASAVDAEMWFNIAGALRQLRNRIEVVGYADARETAGTDLSGWELSLRRALGVAESLRAMGYERDMIVRARYTEGHQPGGQGRLAAEPERPARIDVVGRVDLIVRLEAAEEP